MAQLDLKKAQELEHEYDPEMSFRLTSAPTSYLVYGLLVSLSFYHYYTAGFGIPPEQWHKSIHMGAVLLMVFLVFGHNKASYASPTNNVWWKIGNVPIYDWLLGFAALGAALYIPLTFDTIIYRLGNPNQTDVVVGTIMIATILEATRRSLGMVLPAIVFIFMLYGLFGPYVPIQVLQHPGASWPAFINHVYLSTEGIFGIPVKVIATLVFHFVLFGAIATRMGLGQFFIDIAQCAAGRFAGGPAKVSVIASAFFGTISGSSIANTVTTGSLTIPTMKRAGYPAHFAGAVEAASSTGGQVTPPIMGAAAFIMVEFTQIPYTTIILAAAVPALMHYIGVMTIVHLEAKRLNLGGMPKDEIPHFWSVVRRGWPTVIPLIILITVLFQGYTPYMAAFWGITACMVIGIINPMHRIGLRDIVDAFHIGAKYALVVGAAAAAVGIVIGVVTLSGAGFRISYMVTQAATDVAHSIMAVASILPFQLFTLEGVTLFFTLLFIALTCILMGAGISTTTLYIILATLAVPALTQLGIPLLAAHLFVLYYGVLADITPPVCTSAYAAGAIAGANPFKTGMTAFRLGNAKAMVPFVFVTSPAMLIVIDDYFTWSEFLRVTISCAIGVMLLGAALTGFLFRPLPMLSRIGLSISSVMMVAPGLKPTLWGGAVAGLITIMEFIFAKRAKVALQTTSTAPLAAAKPSSSDGD